MSRENTGVFKGLITFILAKGERERERDGGRGRDGGRISNKIKARKIILNFIYRTSFPSVLGPSRILLLFISILSRLLSLLNLLSYFSHIEVPPFLNCLSLIIIIIVIIINRDKAGKG